MMFTPTMECLGGARPVPPSTRQWPPSRRVTLWSSLHWTGGRRQTFTDSQIRNALRLIESGEPATQVARDLGMSRATLYRRIRELPQATTI